MITVLMGNNNFLLLQNKQKIIAEFINKYGDLGLEQFSAESTESSVKDGLLNLPFLVEKKLVILDEISVNKTLADSVKGWLESAGEAIDVLIIEPNPDKRTGWYKFIVQADRIIKCDDLDELGLSKWIADYVKNQGGEIDNSATKLLIKRVGIDQRQLVNEMNKLINYDTKITESNVVELVDPMPQESIFNLLESMVLGDTPRTMQLYDSLRLSGIDPSEILSMIGWQLHTLALVKSAMTRQGAGTGLHPYVVQKNSAVARKLTYLDIKKLISMTIDAELQIKKDGLASANVVLVLIHKILELVQSKNTAV